MSDTAPAPTKEEALAAVVAAARAFAKTVEWTMPIRCDDDLADKLVDAVAEYDKLVPPDA